MHAGGQGFDSPQLHVNPSALTGLSGSARLIAALTTAAQRAALTLPAQSKLSDPVGSKGTTFTDAIKAWFNAGCPNIAPPSNGNSNTIKPHNQPSGRRGDAQISRLVGGP